MFLAFGSHSGLHSLSLAGQPGGALLLERISPLLFCSCNRFISRNYLSFETLWLQCAFLKKLLHSGW